MKIAKVTPIYKKGSPYMLNNYRPISILPIISKIIERFVNKQLITFLDKYDIIYRNQYGFRKSYSTKLALVDLVTEIINDIDKGNFTLGIFLDLTKAFDTINHNILLSKLRFYGIRGIPFNWFQSYLTNRRQFVHAYGYNSSTLHLNYGVPQGSILGPLLFLIYINDIPSSSNYFNFKLFADDSNLFHSFASKTFPTLETETNIEKVNNWCLANKLTINNEKTNYMIFSSARKNLTYKPVLHFNNNVMKQVQCTTYLGLTIDQHLTWKPHIKKVLSKINPLIGLLAKLRHYLPKATLVLLYNSLILPHLSYGLESWGSTYNTTLDPLYRQQKKLVRIISFKDRLTHSRPLFNSLGILDIFDQFKYQLATFMHDLTLHKLPRDLQHYSFSNPNHTYSTRTSATSNFTIPLFKTNLGQFSITYCGSKLWNSIPANIKSITCRFTFKRTFRNYLMSLYF